VFFGQGRKEALGEKWKSFEFVAADRERKNGNVDGAGAETFEKDGSNFFDDGQVDLREFARERSEMLRKKVRRDGGDYADADGAAEGIFLLDDVAAGGLEFAKNGAGTGKKRFADVGEAYGAAETVEEAGAKFAFELEDLLGERRLGDVGLLGGAAEGSSFGDGAKITKLVEFHV
jgi:hypothetical protein